jgi:hypothetical protein
MATVEEVHNHIVAILTEANISFSTKAERLYVKQGSAAVFIRAEAWLNNHVIVELLCPVLKNIERPANLLDKLNDLNRGLFFGKAYMHDNGVWLAHNLLGDHLDPEELIAALGLLSRVADKLDDELKGSFGGQRFGD